MELSHPVWTGRDKTILCWVMEKAQLANHTEPRPPHSWSNYAAPFSPSQSTHHIFLVPRLHPVEVFCLQKTRSPHLDLTAVFSVVLQPTESPNADASPYVHVHTQDSPCEP